MDTDEQVRILRPCAAALDHAYRLAQRLPARGPLVEVGLADRIYAALAEARARLAACEAGIHEHDQGVVAEGPPRRGRSDYGT